MSDEHFRRIALGMKDAIEGAHMGHPDFRANGKIFATLYPDGEHGMVKLVPDQQRDFLFANPGAFALASGAWGRHGCTMVRLASVAEDQLGEAMTLAWQNTSQKPLRSNGRPRQKRRGRL